MLTAAYNINAEQSWLFHFMGSTWRTQSTQAQYIGLCFLSLHILFSLLVCWQTATDKTCIFNFETFWNEERKFTYNAVSQHHNLLLILTVWSLLLVFHKEIKNGATWMSPQSLHVGLLMVKFMSCGPLHVRRCRRFNWGLGYIHIESDAAVNMQYFWHL